MKNDSASHLDPIAKTMLCLKSVDRWSKTHTVVKENVATHTSEVSLLTWLFVSYLNQNAPKSEQLDLGIALSMALAHDLSEVITGDIITPTKNLIGYDLVKAAEAKAENAIVASSPEHFKSALQAAFGKSPNSDKYKAVVKICDRFVALAFSARELNFGNCEMEEAYKKCKLAFFSDPLHTEFLNAIGAGEVTQENGLSWCKSNIDSAVSDLLTTEEVV